MNSFNMMRKLILAASILGIIVLCFSVGQIFQNVDASEIVVVQSPFSGNLSWYTTPGVKWQGFGKVTIYQKRSQYWFSSRSDQGEKDDKSIKIRFNDGGHGNLSGSLSWELPINEKNLTELHMQYGSQLAIEQQLIRTVVEKSVYMTGPLMSSKESYADRRNELLSFIEDQIQGGVYSTETLQDKQIDQMTGQQKTVNIVRIIKDEKGLIVRADESPLVKFGIKTFNLSINELKYDNDVEEQIRQQQKATMQVQIALADARAAEQKAITTMKEGEATAAKAKWEGETIKAKAVVEAQQKLEVAKLATAEAEQKKLAEIALGEGEAKRRTLVMSADGALEKKLDAYKEVNKMYADAISTYKGNWVPSIVLGGNGNQESASGANQLIQLLMAKTAKDLSLDLSLPNKIEPAAKE